MGEKKNWSFVSLHQGMQGGRSLQCDGRLHDPYSRVRSANRHCMQSVELCQLESLCLRFCRQYNLHPCALQRGDQGREEQDMWAVIEVDPNTGPGAFNHMML